MPPASRPRAPAAPVLAAALAVLLALPAEAQHTEPPEPAAYALEDVTLVQADGTSREGVTLVVRGSLLEAASPGAEVPDDARVLEGDSLRVYPGMVDLDGGTELAWPPAPNDGEESDERPPAAWDPDRREQGFVPHRRAVEALSATGEDLSEAREAGVVASAVHPGGGLAPGRGVLLLHRRDAEHPRSLVLRPELDPVLSFETAGRVYPSTHFAVLAFLRQQLEDAGRHARVRAAHERDPRGMAAPEWDPDYAVLAGTISPEGSAGRGGRVFFRADRAQDIRQVLELAERFGFRPVIVGGEEAWEVAGPLARRDVPVAVSLDFPTSQRWKPAEDGDAPGEEPGGAGPDARDARAAADTAGAGEAGASQETEQELEPAVLREKRRIEDAYANAARLAEAGVRVVLTSGGGEADLREGARRAVEYGLPEARALRAVTATPAALAGVPWLARVEAGSAATFVVTDGPLLGEETRIRYTFVEGDLQEGARPGAEPEEPPAVDVTGSWEMELEASMGTVKADLALEQEGADLSGTMTTQFGTARVVEGVVSGDEVTFTVELEAGGQTLRIDFSGTASGDGMSGSGSGPPDAVGSFTWEAERAGPGGGGDR